MQAGCKAWIRSATLWLPLPHDPHAAHGVVVPPTCMYMVGFKQPTYPSATTTTLPQQPVPTCLAAGDAITGDLTIYPTTVKVAAITDEGAVLAIANVSSKQTQHCCCACMWLMPVSQPCVCVIHICLLLPALQSIWPCPCQALTSAALHVQTRT